jgi:D-amino-acid dehydrogenase
MATEQNGSTPDVTILGAGIVGITTALSLTERGFKVALIDRDPPAEGASYGNAGSLSPWSCVPQSMPGIWKNVPGWLLDPEGPIALRLGYATKFLPWAVKFLQAGQEDRLPTIADAMMALTRPTVTLYRHHLQGTGSEELVRDSVYVHVFRNAADADLSKLSWRMRAERQVPLEVVKGDALREVEPALSPDFEAAVLIKQQGRALDPGGIGKALAEKAQNMGVSFQQCSVEKLVPEAGGTWRIETDAGPLQANRLVVAMGAWSGKLMQDLGIKAPLEAERGYHLVFRDPGVSLNNAIMNVDAKFVVSSMAAGVRCAGTAEFAGIDAPPDYRRARIFKNLAKRMFPDINTEDTEEWMGPRPSTPDSVPYLGEVPGFANLYAAYGHGHTGMTMGPKTGEVIATLISGEPVDVDMTPYRIDRFG